MKKFNRSLTNFLLAFMLMIAFGAKLMAITIVGGAVVYVCNKINSIYGSAYTGFITAGSEYHGKENEDIIIRPFFLGQLPQDMGVKVISTIKSTIKLTFWNPKSKILKAYADGFQGGAGATIKQKKLELQEFKAEAEYSKQTYKNLIQENITDRGGIAQNEITGDTVHQAEVAVFMAGIKEDARRIFWLGKKTKKTLDATGTYYTVTADGDYNVIDGIWTSIFGSYTNYASATAATDLLTVRRVTIATSAIAQVDTHTLTGTSGTANITINGVTYLATYTTSLTVSATNFVTSWAAALALVGITATSSGVTVILTAATPEQPFISTLGVNVSGDLAGTLVHTTANTPAADLTTDQSKTIFKTMHTKATKILKSLIAESTGSLTENTGTVLNKMSGMVNIYCTDTIIENYRDSMENQLLADSRSVLINGIKRLTYRGMVLMPMDIDSYLLSDFNEPYPHRAIMTATDNLVMVVNGTGDFAETKFWFNPDLNVNRQRAQFEFGADYVLPEIMIVAF